MENNMERVSIILPRVKLEEANGKKEREFNGSQRRQPICENEIKRRIK